MRWGGIMQIQIWRLDKAIRVFHSIQEKFSRGQNINFLISESLLTKRESDFCFVIEGPNQLWWLKAWWMQIWTHWPPNNGTSTAEGHRSSSSSAFPSSADPEESRAVAALKDLRRSLHGLWDLQHLRKSTSANQRDTQSLHLGWTDLTLRMHCLG